MLNIKRVLIMAGGTGGHVFPGLTLANYLRQKNIEVHWLGTERGIESQLVPEAQIPLHLVNVGGLRGKGIKPLLAAPFKLTQSVIQSRDIIKKINPDMVIGFGGFVSGPGGVATYLLRKPLIIHEQNAKAGYTNRILSKFAARTLQGFPNAFPPRSKVITVGNPVRFEIENILSPIDRFNHAVTDFKLLVVGGSLGAQVFNQFVPAALAKMPAHLRPYIRQQTGPKHYADAAALYQTNGISLQRVELMPFIKDMAEAYSWADMVLCRAGALTVAEICAAGVGAIFVPYPHAVDDHQSANASYLVANNAAICIQQRDLTVDYLAKIVTNYAENPQERRQMAEAAYQLRQVNVVEKIYAIMCDLDR